MALKNIYLTFVRNCKNTNAHTLPAINLMRNLAVELYGIDQELSYKQAFVYIRQLAVTLRNAMQTKTKVKGKLLIWRFNKKKRKNGWGKEKTKNRDFVNIIIYSRKVTLPYITGNLFIVSIFGQMFWQQTVKMNHQNYGH